MRAGGGVANCIITNPGPSERERRGRAGAGMQSVRGWKGGPQRHSVGQGWGGAARYRNYSRDSPRLLGATGQVAGMDAGGGEGNRKDTGVCNSPSQLEPHMICLKRREAQSQAVLRRSRSRLGGLRAGEEGTQCWGEPPHAPLPRQGQEKLHWESAALAA